MFGTKLNATIAKVQGFITDLEVGVEANEKVLTANSKQIDTITAKENAKLKEIKTKAVVERATVTTKSGELLEQNRIATKLLSKLK